MGAHGTRAGTCAHQRQRLSLLVDGELPPGERLVLRLHLARCAACRAFRDDISQLATTLRATSLTVPLGAARRRRRPALRVSPGMAAGAVAVLAVAIGTSSLVPRHENPAAGALSPRQGLPVYRAPYSMQGLPVYVHVTPRTIRSF